MILLCPYIAWYIITYQLKVLKLAYTNVFFFLLKVYGLLLNSATDTNNNCVYLYSEMFLYWWFSTSDHWMEPIIHLNTCAALLCVNKFYISEPILDALMIMIS